MGAQIKDGKIQHQHIHLDEKFERRIMVVTGQETKMSLQQSIQKYLLIQLILIRIYSKVFIIKIVTLKSFFSDLRRRRR